MKRKSSCRGNKKYEQRRSVDELSSPVPSIYQKRENWGGGSRLGREEYLRNCGTVKIM